MEKVTTRDRGKIPFHGKSTKYVKIKSTPRDPHYLFLSLILSYLVRRTRQTVDRTDGPPRSHKPGLRHLSYNLPAISYPHKHDIFSGLVLDPDNNRNFPHLLQN